MDLRKASLLLISGLIYTVFYKAVIGFVPFVSNIVFLRNILSVLLLLSSLSIIIFVFYFLKESPVLNSKIKISLQLIFFFTCILILLGLPIGLQPQNRIFRNFIFEAARLLNSFSILMFFIFFIKIISIESIRKPIKLAIWGFSIGLVLGLVSFGYYMNFLITGTEVIPFPPLQYLAIIVFLFTYIVVTYFLIQFRKLLNNV